ncbi:MAG: SMC-Scp complex subunit ScpB [Ardenticatenales bacterium]|nr:SMC-Scp complex subunit ScpB [Ardenticatenales bacterium]
MASEPIERRARTSRNGSGPASAHGTNDAVTPTFVEPQRGLPVDGDAVQLAAGALGASTHTTGLDLAALIEAILFVTDRPVAVSEMAKVLEVPRPMVERALGDLSTTLVGRGVRLLRRNGTVQMVSAPEAAPVVQRILGLTQDGRLSRPALETLSIIAYRQPLTRPEIESLRGVSSEGVLRTLLSRELIEPLGRRATVGNPVEYGTTLHFLAYFGLTCVSDLPPIEAYAAADRETDGDTGQTTGQAIGQATDDTNGDAPVDVRL